METALEENRRMNSDRADAMLVRAYNMYRHPLLLSLQRDVKKIVESGEKDNAVFKGDNTLCKTVKDFRKPDSDTSSVFNLFFLILKSPF